MKYILHDAYDISKPMQYTLIYFYFVQNTIVNQKKWIIIGVGNSTNVPVRKKIVSQVTINQNS